MSSFFTTPSAPKKRKQSTGDRSSSKRSKTSKPTRESEAGARKRSIQDEDISSDSEVEGKAVSEDEDEDEDFSHETPAERRLRLAQQYLDNLKADIGA